MPFYVVFISLLYIYKYIYVYIYIYIFIKSRFRVYKSDAIAGKDRRGVAKHFLTRCTHSNS